MAERFGRIEEVVGSIPIASTRRIGVVDEPVRCGAASTRRIGVVDGSHVGHDGGTDDAGLVVQLCGHDLGPRRQQR